MFWFFLTIFVIGLILIDLGNALEDKSDKPPRR